MVSYQVYSKPGCSATRNGKIFKILECQKLMYHTFNAEEVQIRLRVMVVEEGYLMMRFKCPVSKSHLSSEDESGIQDLCAG